MNAKGIDVSHWQATTPDLTGLTFLIARATIGGSKDDKYDMHVANARAAGLLVGAYHFNRDKDNDATAPTAVEQARLFVDSAGDADFLALDVEGAYAFEADESKEFIAEVQRLGRKVGLYMSESAFRDDGQDWDWVAHWDVAQPTRAWDIHQYRGSPLDLDQFNGTPAEMRAWVAANGGTMPDIATYLPGYVCILKGTSNVRSTPFIQTTNKLRTVPSGSTETWTVVGFVKGDVDPDSGSDLWVARWANGRWEYTAKGNLKSGPAQPVDVTPFDQSDIDAAVATATAPMQATIDAQAATISTLKTDLAESASEVESVKADLAEADARITALNTELNDAEAELASNELVLDEYDALREALRKAIA